MRSFIDLDKTYGSQPRPLGAVLARIDTGRGQEKIFEDQRPELLRQSADRAGAASPRGGLRRPVRSRPSRRRAARGRSPVAPAPPAPRTRSSRAPNRSRPRPSRSRSRVVQGPARCSRRARPGRSPRRWSVEAAAADEGGRSPARSGPRGRSRGRDQWVPSPSTSSSIAPALKGGRGGGRSQRSTAGWVKWAW